MICTFEGINTEFFKMMVEYIKDHFESTNLNHELNPLLNFINNSFLIKIIKILKCMR